MAIGFGQANGMAKKNSANYYEYKNGDNAVRLVGGILPRYQYWVSVPGKNSNIPFECLAFDRDTESFLNAEKDWVQEYFPDLKCGWAYAIQCIVDGELKVLPLKKKLLEQIKTGAEDLGDPTDPDTGYVIHFKKVKTGPNTFNVEYQYQPLKSKPTPLTDEERKLVEDSKSIDEMLPRPSAEDQRKQLEALLAQANGEDPEADNSADSEIENEFDIDK